MSAHPVEDIKLTSAVLLGPLLASPVHAVNCAPRADARTLTKSPRT